jgi:DNA modification methylase
MDWCLNFLASGATVFDAFAGSGSTLLAAERTNRTCYAVELDPKYVDVIIARWEKLTGQTAELIEG